jgi:glyoxylase-like metal-dependent hydrolase (beta-lactamase superfamily II)
MMSIAKFHLRGLTAAIAVVITFASILPTDSTAAPSSQEFLPLPDGAKPQSQNEHGYRLQKIGNSSYVIIAEGEQAVFVVTAAGVVLVDAPPAIVEKLNHAIRSVTHKPVTHIILSHDHFDHIGGITEFKGAKLISHQITADLLKLYPDPKRPVPTITFSEAGHTFNIGGQRFDLIYPGPNHEAGNI